MDGEVRAQTAGGCARLRAHGRRASGDARRAAASRCRTVTAMPICAPPGAPSTSATSAGGVRRQDFRWLDRDRSCRAAPSTPTRPAAASGYARPWGRYTRARPAAASAPTSRRQPSGDSELETSGGTIRVELADGIALDVEANGGSGGVHSDFPIGGSTHSEHTLRGPLNGGGPRLYLRASGGIEIERR